jgi:hypothetical protein
MRVKVNLSSPLDRHGRRGLARQPSYLLCSVIRREIIRTPMRMSYWKVAALAVAPFFAGGCGSGRHEPAESRAVSFMSREPGSQATPTTDASFQLLAADGPTRFATLQDFIIQSGNHCSAVTKGVFEGSLDGTDEWSVDCVDGGAWQLWIGSNRAPEVSARSKRL